jgi:hypothetical protein
MTDRASPAGSSPGEAGVFFERMDLGGILLPHRVVYDRHCRLRMVWNLSSRHDESTARPCAVRRSALGSSRDRHRRRR